MGDLDGLEQRRALSECRRARGGQGEVRNKDGFVVASLSFLGLALDIFVAVHTHFSDYTLSDHLKQSGHYDTTTGG